MKNKKQLGIGIAGFGTVGSGVYKALKEQHDFLLERSGYEFEVRAIAVRHLHKDRSHEGIETPHHLMTDSWQKLLEDPEIIIVIELMGGIEEALAFVRAALTSGRIVVTGNKALLAEHGKELMELAQEHQSALFFEAAVAGGIPVIKALQEGFVGNKIEKIEGILNGTTNYILSKMEAEPGLDYQPTLKEAMERGYAEADPTLDVNGWDAGHKTLILAALAYGSWLPPESLYVDGITRISALDIAFAQELGYSIKLLASIHQEPGEQVSFHVAPTLIPQESMLASVSGVFNAVAIQGNLVGESLFYGRGAGKYPTTSAVLADLIEAAHFAQQLELKEPLTSYRITHQRAEALPTEEISSSFYLRLGVDDQPGVLSMITHVFGELGIGIASLIQPESSPEKYKPLVIMTYRSSLGMLQKAIGKLKLLPCLQEEPLLLFVNSE